MVDAIGDRMKLYEAAWKPQFPPRMPIIVRVDGRAFHSFTRGMDKPFDEFFIDVMKESTRLVHENTQGSIFAYTQSDEASFLLQTDRSLQSQMPWGGDVMKIVSTTAAQMTAFLLETYGTDRLAHFDARAFVMPWDDVPNYFLWRYRDWVKNSVTMAALAHFSHKQLHEKNTGQKLQMLREAGHPWEDFADDVKNGTFIGGTVAMPVNYESLKATIDALRVDPVVDISDVKWGGISISRDPDL